MKIKICGLTRDEDIDYVNKARPDYIGFVFAKSKRQVTPVMAQYLRFRLAEGILPVGVFVDAPVKEIAELYKKGIISIAQLHGGEDEAYILRLKEVTDGIPVIKTKKMGQGTSLVPTKADFYLLDSGSGSGKPFDWNIIKQFKFDKPWFLAGGIDLKNIDKVMALNPFGIDVSSGVETGGLKDRKKILKLTSIVRPPENIEVSYTKTTEQHRKKLSWNIQ